MPALVARLPPPVANAEPLVAVPAAVVVAVAAALRALLLMTVAIARGGAGLERSARIVAPGSRGAGDSSKPAHSLAETSQVATNETQSPPLAPHISPSFVSSSTHLWRGGPRRPG